jgi:hypothetical protein
MGDNQSLPAYVTAAPANNFTFVWDPSTGDVRAPLKLASATDRIAACWGAANSFTVALNFTDGLTHQVAVYAMDWDNYFSRTETVDVVDANGVLLDSRPLAGFFSGQYLVWNLSGRVTLRVTNTNAQSNAVISGIFFGAGAGSPPPAATFVKTDTTTQGNWKSAYGSQGAIVVGDSSVLPAYAAVSTAGSGTFVWEQSTGDTRAPLKGASATDRIAACWVSLTSFTIAVNFTDGQPHQIALYALDWDNYFGRRQTVEILDAGGAVVDTRTQSDFTGGQYLVWKVNGPVTIRVTNNNGPSNAVVSGLFIDPGV